MEIGTIVKVSDVNRRGIVLRVEDDQANLLHYDFTTSWELLDDLEVLGHSDAIYKVMYEMMR